MKKNLLKRKENNKKKWTTTEDQRSSPNKRKNKRKHSNYYLKEPCNPLSIQQANILEKNQCGETHKEGIKRSVFYEGVFYEWASPSQGGKPRFESSLGEMPTLVLDSASGNIASGGGYLWETKNEGVKEENSGLRF